MRLVLAWCILWLPTIAVAQSNAATDSGLSAADEPYVLLDDEALQTLVGPIALYPDDLLAIVLPASTTPLQIVQASRFLATQDDTSTASPNEDWDESVVALLNYPEVLALLNDDLDWTWRLGEAVLYQQEDVLSAVAEFRELAKVSGNLKSDDKQVVSVEDDVVHIRPAEREQIYVPYYDPDEVTTYRNTVVYHYYPDPYPVYYYPYAYGHVFPRSRFWGVRTWFGIGWPSYRLHTLHHSYFHHPYYSYDYRYHYYHRGHRYDRRRPAHRYRHHGRFHDDNRWRPHHRAQARVRHREERRARRHERNREHRRAENAPLIAARGSQHLRRSTANRDRSSYSRPPVSPTRQNRRGAVNRESTYSRPPQAGRRAERRQQTARNHPRQRDQQALTPRQQRMRGAVARAKDNPRAAQRATRNANQNRANQRRATQRAEAAPRNRARMTTSNSRPAVRAPSRQARPNRPAAARAQVRQRPAARQSRPQTRASRPAQARSNNAAAHRAPPPRVRENRNPRQPRARPR